MKSLRSRAGQRLIDRSPQAGKIVADDTLEDIDSDVVVAMGDYPRMPLTPLQLTSGIVPRASGQAEMRRMPSTMSRSASNDATAGGPTSSARAAR